MNKDSMTQMTLVDFLELTASDAPAPGGGSVAALAAALGAALGKMVLCLSYGKKSYEALPEETRKSLEAAGDDLVELRGRFLGLIDKDTEAFMGYMKALKMPKATDDEKAARSAALAAAALASTRAPLDTVETCVDCARLLPQIAEFGNKNAVTDAGVASLMCRAACESAIFNVKINLPSVKDEAFVKEAGERCDKALKEIDKLNASICKTVYSRI